jgi:OOP family OmpA-OmpF porin
MKGKNLLFVLAAIAFLLAFSAAGYCNEKPTCAVLIFYPDVSSTEMNEGRYLSEQYADILSRVGLFEVINHKEVTQMLEEKNAANMNQACSSKDCALAVGQLLNVDYAIYGVIGHIGNLSSLETGLVNVKNQNEAQRAVTDFEGSQQEFADVAPSENIKSLFGVTNLPKKQEIMEEETVSASKPVVQEDQPAQIAQEEKIVEPVKKQKNFYIGPRIGVGATNDGVEFGGGLEAQFKHLACQFLMNTEGFAAGISYYLNQEGNSPFLTLAGTYYDTENHGVDEIGRIYGLLLGYRLNITDQLNARLGLGAGYVNWDQTEFNGKGTKDKDEEVIPIFEVSLGYSFGFMSSAPAPVAAVAPPKVDSDQDGVFDDDDACPGTPVGVSVDARGCPADRDKDGVTDDNDKCPDTPEGAQVDTRGCWVIPGVLFDTDRTTLNDEHAENLLSTVVMIMNHFPDRRYEIQGHTDNVGEAVYNQKLSEQRAISVKNFLVYKGISPNRLTTAGFGFSNPVTSNETEDGRATNRRVEIKPIF